jgi:Uma2 family endonuclease
MTVATSRMSAAEYLATPEDRPRHTELINGVVVVHEPKLTHTRPQTKILVALAKWTEVAPDRGEAGVPVDVPIDDRNVFAPDVWWVSEEHRPTTEQDLLDRVPDLVVEVRSPSTWARDLKVKLPAYEAAGVAEAWFVDTEARTVLVFRRSTPASATFDMAAELGADEELTSPLLPGFALLVGSIFER